MIDTLMPLIKQFLPYAQKRMGFTQPPRLFLRGDADNASNPLGRTAHYDPQEKAITLYIMGRHPKDVMRSLSHELVHHKQNCNGQFDDTQEMGEGYAQSDEHLREMEREAYETGNMCFRDWEDSIKSTIYFEHLQKGEKKMSIKDWKNNEISTLLAEAWGFKFNTLQEFNEFNGTGEIQEVSTGDPDIGEEESEGKAIASTEEEDLPPANEGVDDDDADVVEEEEELEERSSAADAHPVGPGRKVTKANGERVTSEGAARGELQEAIEKYIRNKLKR